MGRVKRTRLWIALPGGIIINGLLLAGLILYQRVMPMAEEPPAVEVLLERPPARRKTLSTPIAPERPLATTRAAGSPHPAFTVSAPAEILPTTPPPVVIDPAWAVDGGAWVDPARRAQALARWRLVEGGPGTLHKGRIGRACAGLSNEHLTDEEKDRCYGDWREAEKRMEARFGGALAKPPPSRYARDAAHQERCRAYRSKRTPGNTTGGSSLGFPGVSDGVPLSQGGCF